MPAPPGRRQQQPPTEADDAWGNARVAMALAVYDSQYPRCSELWDVFELRGEPWLRLEVCKGSVSGLLGYPRSLARPAPESLRPADGVSWCDVFCSFITPPPKQPELHHPSSKQ
ncbi:hypothetical protein DIPPA_08667 [Diplonema papillatum]|nr:hypothetical protein DIPPA_08667 [Diplonema papillatum]